MTLTPSAARSSLGPWAATGRAIANRPTPYLWCTAIFVAFFNLAIVIGLLVQQAFDGIEAGDRAQVFWAAGLLALVEVTRIAVFHPGIWTFAAAKALVSSQLRMNMVSAQVASGGPLAAPPVASPASVTPQFRDDPEDVVLFADGWIDSLGGLVFAVVSIGIIGAVSPIAAVVAVVATLVVAGLAATLDGALKRAKTNERRAAGALTEMLGDLMQSPATISVNGATADATGVIGSLAAERSRWAVRSRVLEQSLQAFSNGLGPVALACVILFGLGAIVEGSLDAAALALFATYFSYLSILPNSSGRLLARRSQTVVVLDNMTRVAGDADRLVAPRPLPILRRDPVPAPTATGAPPRPARAPADRLHRLDVRALSVRTTDGTVLVPPTDLVLEAGTMTVVAGEVGTGKSLLVRALLGQLDRTDLLVEGEVRWNDAVVADRAAFLIPPRAAHVAQLPAFLTDTVTGNLALGQRNDLATRLRTAVDAAELGPDLDDLAAGLDTEIGPRGVRLSGGQRQRLAVARALFAGADLVVLDDVSSALDVATEARLWDNLRAGGFTVLATSNRAVAQRVADRILTLDRA